MANFDVEFLQPAKSFIDSLEEGTRKKVLFNIWRSKDVLDPKLFQKLDKNIWEFRTRVRSKQIRLLAFWDKRKQASGLIIVTHGFVKKERKLPLKELERAKKMRMQYFDNK